MKHLRKFNENIDKISEFTNKFKNLVDYDEDEYEQGDEPSNVDLLSEIGELCNEFEMTSDDLQQVIDNGDDTIDNLIQILHDETLQSEAEGGQMSKAEIIEALENLRYFEDTDEDRWEETQNEADRAIETLKKIL